MNWFISKVRASVLVESLIATVIIAMVLSIGLTVIYGSVWTSATNNLDAINHQFASIETQMRNGVNPDEDLFHFDSYTISIRDEQTAEQLQQVTLEAVDARNKILGTHSFLFNPLAKK